MPFIQQITSDFLHLLFPEHCNACGVQLVHGEKQICIRCLYDLPYTDFHLFADNPVARLFWGRMPFQGAMSLLYFRKGSKVQDLIHRIKYNGNTELGFMLGCMIGEKILLTGQKTELIIPIPLHRLKERKRGYNQSKCIADGIAKVLQLPVNTKLLTRKINTGTQTKRSRYNRFENMEYIFRISQSLSLKHKAILLVDDVITTGATLESCGHLLLANGFENLSVATVAYAE
ncbi:ComF family protein [Pedobacter cryoconitis]|uniref:ComF family protein n=1 Tax=Pedobacter cryoconitis TaxID=188932 RepID=A0A7X0ML76_9SPHI|nr:phosphoribosyltransferase family protein [Pedobacter cryoconitis]MBB6501500.1 ComF family protein [Pedobacter cryoconitis]